MPLCLPAFPLPFTVSCMPSPTPAGIFTSTTSSPYTMPSPEQCLHLFLMILPSPLQFGHTACVCIMPKMLCWVRVTLPVPWQFGQVSVPEFPSAPEPWQCSQVTYFFSLNFFSTPLAMSFRFILTFTRRSEPRNLRCCGRPPPPPNPPNPLNPPNPPPPPKMSPNIEKMSSMDMPCPNPPAPAAPPIPAWPNWS